MFIDVMTSESQKDMTGLGENQEIRASSGLLRG